MYLGGLLLGSVICMEKAFTHLFTVLLPPRHLHPLQNLFRKGCSPKDRVLKEDREERYADCLLQHNLVNPYLDRRGSLRQCHRL